MPSSPKTHEFVCRLTWTGKASGPTADYRTYSRALSVEADGKPALAMSSAPAFLGDASVHNPEDALVFALTSCHCLSYLALAAPAGVAVISYEDKATGLMEWNGKTFRFTQVTLKPMVTVAKGADVEKAKALHNDAHEVCFIAQSVNFPVTNEPTIIESA